MAPGQWPGKSRSQLSRVHCARSLPHPSGPGCCPWTTGSPALSLPPQPWLVPRSPPHLQRRIHVQGPRFPARRTMSASTPPALAPAMIHPSLPLLPTAVSPPVGSPTAGPLPPGLPWPLHTPLPNTAPASPQDMRLLETVRKVFAITSLTPSLLP